MLEGPDLLRAALDAGAALEEVVVDDAADAEVLELGARASELGAALRTVAHGALSRACDARSSQGICATCPCPLAERDAALSGPVVVLDSIADPGNLGTAIRTAHATGCDGVVVCGAGVDVCSPKVLRATVGSIFFVRVALGGELPDVLGALRARGRRSVAAVPRGGRAPWDVALADAAIVVGSEAHGIDPDAAAACDELVTIPMARGAESLNAAVAASVLCVEAMRQRDAERGGSQASPTI